MVPHIVPCSVSGDGSSCLMEYRWNIGSPSSEGARGGHWSHTHQAIWYICQATARCHVLHLMDGIYRLVDAIYLLPSTMCWTASCNILGSQSTLSTTVFTVRVMIRAWGRGCGCGNDDDDGVDVEVDEDDLVLVVLVIAQWCRTHGSPRCLIFESTLIIYRIMYWQNN